MYFTAAAGTADEESIVIDVARIDHWAATGSGAFHRASALSKLLFLFLVVAGAVTANTPFPLMAGYAVILVVIAASRMPWARMILWSLYALLFALLYGTTLRGGPLVYLLLAFKAITPSLAMLALVVSTPYPRIFSLISTVLPELLAASLFMTYRTFFILIDMMHNFGAAIRLRGGFSPGSLWKNSSNIAKGIGMLLVTAVERASRLYAVMSVRGYTGSMARKGPDGLRHEDWLPLGTGAVVLMLVILWK
jgi:energy-coupling factor transporter transmembrane protein EcfT